MQRRSDVGQSPAGAWPPPERLAEPERLDVGTHRPLDGVGGSLCRLRLGGHCDKDRRRRMRLVRDSIERSYDVVSKRLVLVIVLAADEEGAARRVKLDGTERAAVSSRLAQCSRRC